jgi:hypothetical protein
MRVAAEALMNGGIAQVAAFCAVIEAMKKP